jgi:hypothetical protein
VLATAWAAFTVALLWPGWSAQAREIWLILSVATAVILLVLGFLRTVRGARSPAAD